MFIKFSYEDSFEHLILDLKDKYDKRFLEISGLSDEYLDITKYSKNYFSKKHSADTTMDKNANVQANHIGVYNAERFKGHAKLNSLYRLWGQLKKLYGTKEADRLIEIEFNKTINMQDGYDVSTPYCWNFATYDLIQQGLPFIAGVNSDPPKHSDTFLQHIIQLCMFAATDQLLGATSIGDALIVYSYLLQKDSLNPKYFIPNYKKDPEMFDIYLKQILQQFVYTMNQPVRKNQSIFTNITLFDQNYLEEIKKLYIFDEDKTIDTEFAMFIQKKFVQFFNEYNKVQLFTFPVLTAQIKVNANKEIEDKEFFDFICEENLQFANLNIFASENLNALSSCCRLQSSIEAILHSIQNENTNLIGGSSLKVGSFGVTTINLPRIALDTKGNEEEFIKVLEERVVDCIKMNHARRELIKRNIDMGQLPLYKYNFIKLEQQYSTVGILGFYECIDFFGKDILSQDGKNFGIKVLESIKKVIDERIKKLGYRINCEQIPGESTASKFAEADTLLGKQNSVVLYSNQFIPLVKNANLIDRIELQAYFEKYMSGGSILHVNVGEKISSKDIMKKLISFTIKQGVKYHAINYFFAKCEGEKIDDKIINQHMTVSVGDLCPICGKKIIERYSRIVGFIVPFSAMQKERRAEFLERKKYTNGSLKIGE